jgi:hypothetical protein
VLATSGDRATCIACHQFGTFEDGHPEFQFARDALLDPANLRFPHVLHVEEVMLADDLIDLEEACLACHEPVDDGASFQPISYGRHCDDCHLSPRERTAVLPVTDGSRPGVVTLAELRASPGPSAAPWVGSVSAAEFESIGGGVRKSPVLHADPWILENLRRLRSRLFPGAELADLLVASSDLPGGDPEVLYREAVRTLRSQIAALRSDPDATVQRELQTLEEELDEVERRLEDPLGTLDETRFDLRTIDRSDEPLDLEAFETLVDDLTEACQECHVVRDATLLRVQAAQSSLARTDFDHRAHIIHARCVDCHTQIPFTDYVGGTDAPPEELDNASILNLPTVETCRTCHGPSKADASCVTCHAFHPDKSQWSNLSRFHR